MGGIGAEGHGLFRLREGLIVFPEKYIRNNQLSAAGWRRVISFDCLFPLFKRSLQTLSVISVYPEKGLICGDFTQQTISRCELGVQRKGLLYQLPGLSLALFVPDLVKLTRLQSF